MAETPEPRHQRVLAGVAIVVVLVLTGARLQHGTGQVPRGLLVGSVVVVAVLVVLMISAHRTWGRRRTDR